MLIVIIITIIFITGKATEHKRAVVLGAWADHVQSKHNEVRLPYVAPCIEDQAPKKDKEVFDLTPLKQETLVGMEPFNIGDNVRLVSRTSRPCPSKKKTCQREPHADITEKHEGVVLGWVEGKPLIKFTINHEGTPHEMTHTHDIANVVLASEALPSSSAKEEKKTAQVSGQAKEKKALVPQGCSWLLKGLKEDEKTECTSVEDWATLEFEDTQLCGTHTTKAYVTVFADFLCREFPRFGKADLLVINRAQRLGYTGKTQEVWTKRAFEAGELRLAPQTSEIKECGWTGCASAMVQLPKALSRRIGGKTLALDGRLRKDYRAASEGNLGVLPQKAAAASLFFVMERTQAKKEANLALAYAHIDISASINAGGNKRAKVALAKDECPQVPYLVNPQAIPAHTKLVAIDDLALNVIRERMQKEKVEQLKRAAAAAAKKEKAQKAAAKAKQRLRK